jgi:hypothetical protein
MWELRRLIHFGFTKTDISAVHLIVSYDTIAPRAMLFGFFITRRRVMSFFFSIITVFVPKIMTWADHKY